MGTVLGCVLVADFLTGVVHWFEDTYGLPSWPLLGKAVIEPNIHHHLQPQDLANSTFWQRNYQALVPLVVVLGLLWWFVGSGAWPIMLTLVLAAVGNEVHVWNHRKPSGNPWFVRFLQASCVIQTPRQHAQHHRAPYDRYFCTLTNLTNEVLELVRFWSGLEWLIWRVSGVRPKRMTVWRENV